LCYLLGLGTGRDYEKAFYWTKKAAALGYCDAVLALAWHYHNGFGIRKDLKSAKRCYSACFATEYSDSAYFGMGQIAYEDDGDYKAAFEFFMNAARKGHAKACYFLGRMYFEGRGVDNYANAGGHIF
jgi:TPR repeat protein